MTAPVTATEWGTMAEAEALPTRFAEVIHVDLASGDGTPSGRRGGARAVVVLWQDDVPVGQVLVEPDDDLEALVRETARGLRPAPAPPAGPATPPDTVSLVICTRDRPDELARCLESLARQTRRPDEVVVVDNASRTEETRTVALRAGVRYLREDRPGLDVARNTGLLAARSDLIAFTDDDTELHPRWLERLVAAFDDDAVLAVTGLVLPASLDTEAQWLFETRWGFGQGFQRTDFGADYYRRTRSRGMPAWKFGAGANMAFRRSVVDAVGLFDERLDVGAAGCSGDSEYWYRIVAAGWTCRYEPSAVVHHHHRRDMDGLHSQIYHYMRGHVAGLLVQFERTRDVGNLTFAFGRLPVRYARKLVDRARGRQTSPTLGLEIRGCLAGAAYYLRTSLLRRRSRRATA